LLGVLLGPVFGKVSGVFIAFLNPFADIGIGQSPMLRGELALAGAALFRAAARPSGA